MDGAVEYAACCPVGNLRQTPEEVHAIITAALSVSGQEEQSECNAPAQMADTMRGVSGPPSLPTIQQHLQHHQQSQVQAHQLQASGSWQHQVPMTPMASNTANPICSQQGWLNYHPHFPKLQKQQQQQSPMTLGL